MKIVFLNVWHGRRTTELRDFLLSNADSTDVFCFQEAYKEFQVNIEKILPNFKPFMAAKELNPYDNFSQAIYLKNNIEVLLEGQIFQDDPTCGLANFVEVQRHDQHINICNFHGFSRPADKLDTEARQKQSAGLIRAFEHSTIPVVIGGDFNLLPQTRSILIFEAHGYKNLVSDYKIITTRDHLAWDSHPDNKQLFSDYVFTNNRVKVTDFSVPSSTISDHLPLILTLE